MKLILFTDGGARGNPGPAATGVVLKNEKNETIKEVGSYIGIGTNNDAEYKALIQGMKTALEKKPSELSCFLDSELAVKQLNGEYKVKNEKIKGFYKEIKSIETQIPRVSYTHVTRDKNKEADKIVNDVLDSL